VHVCCDATAAGGGVVVTTGVPGVTVGLFIFNFASMYLLSFKVTFHGHTKHIRKADAKKRKFGATHCAIIL
jgi:hypothetical protein